jgi:uncharacterized protein (UPF0276 family)
MIPAIGYAISERNRAILTDSTIGDAAINAVEITFDQTQEPTEVERVVRRPAFDLISLHMTQFASNTSEIPDLPSITAVRALAIENGANSVSAELGVEDAFVAAKHRTPRRSYSDAFVARTCHDVEMVQRSFGDLHFYLENPHSFLRFHGPITDADFLRKVLGETGCGWLLDVTKTYVDALNCGCNAYDFVEEVLPSAHRVQMHIAGVTFDEQAHLYVDSRSHVIPEPVFDLYQFVLEKGFEKVDATFIERDRHFPDEAKWHEEVRTVREIAEAVGAIA